MAIATALSSPMTADEAAASCGCGTDVALDMSVQTESRAAEADHQQERLRTEDVLVVVDGSDASNRAVGYAGQILPECDDIEIHLVFIATNLPPALLEFGGSESPEQEERLDAELLRGRIAGSPGQNGCPTLFLMQRTAHCEGLGWTPNVL